MKKHILGWMKRLRFFILLLAILLYCLVTAIKAEVGGSLVPDQVFAIVFLAIILAISGNENKFFLGLGGLILAKVVVFTLSYWITLPELHALQSFIAMLFFIFMMLATLHLTLKDETIGIITLLGSLSSYLFMGLAFAYLYLIIDSFLPGQFSGLQPYVEIRSIYFSFIILTTVGFADVVAHNPLVQTLSWIEAFLGQAYMAIFISRLVGHYIADEIRRKHG